MTKLTYASMKLKPNNETISFDFQGHTVEVLKYLPIEEKYELIMTSLREAEESNGFYNEIKLDWHFWLNLVYCYTNISFTEKQRENEEKIYDCLVTNGFFIKFFKVLPSDEYDVLMDYLKEVKEGIIVQKNSCTGLIRSIIADLPKQAEAMGEIINTFDKEKYKEVLNFAKAANGGQEI